MRSIHWAAAVLAAVAMAGPIRAQPAGADAAFRDVVRPFLVQNCVSCHNAKTQTSGLNLETIASPDIANATPAIWPRVLDKLSSGEMPPVGIPRPPTDQVERVTAWIRASFKVAAPAGPRKSTGAGVAGHVTLRRLNRTEYDNTIHDLLGLTVNPADDFPVDDSGYGFDNIGDVLSLSPLLMEKYIAAAAKVSKLAVYGPEVPKAGVALARFRAANLPTVGSLPVNLTFRILPYSLRGVLAGTFDFAWSADYEFSFRPSDARGLDKPYIPPPLPGEPPAPVTAGATATGGGGGAGAGPGRRGRRQLTPEEIKARDAQLAIDYPPARWVFELDGKQVMEGSHAGGYNIDQGAYPNAEFRHRLDAGVHSFRIYYPQLSDVPDPMVNIIAARKTRALAVNQLEILGPFNAIPAKPESYQRIFVCPDRTEACAGRIVDSFATRAWRRRAAPDEVSVLLGIVRLSQSQGKPFEEGIRAAVQAVLISPNFLFHVERSEPARTSAALPRPNSLFAKPAAPAHDDSPGPSAVVRAYPLNGYELASRLSYFFWSSMPDDKLFQEAKDGSLSRPDVLRAETRRLLADPKSRALVENFGGQWLGLRELGRRRPDPELFPRVDDNLIDYMREETYLFLGDLLRNDQSILDLVDAPYTYLNGPLARHYGIEGVRGYDFQRVEIKTPRRGGILSHASVLTVSSMPTRTSVVTRGKWVLENLLGTPPPPPPADVPSLNETGLGQAVTLRQRMEQHRADPACAACHNILDPIGFGLENYDPAGAWRETEGLLPIDNSGVLPDGRAFHGAVELKTLLKDQPGLISRGIAEKMLTFALGRGLEPYDRPAIDTIVEKLKANGYRTSALIEGIVESKPFQMKDGER